MLKSHNFKISVLKGVFVCVLVFICVFFHMHSASAHGKHANASKETVTADKARNSRSAIREFVLHAKAHWELQDPHEQSLDLWQKILGEIYFHEDWKSGSNYLILVDKQGRSVAHGYYESATGTDISTWRDAKGTDVVQKLINAAQANKRGGFVDYYWDDPNDPSDSNTLRRWAYAINCSVSALGIELVLIGGLHHDEVVPTVPEIVKRYAPEVRADSVKDPDTLKNFVEKAAEFLSHVYEISQGKMDITNLLTASNKNKTWKYNEIYLFAFTRQGLVVFNGNDPSLLRTPTYNLVDENGVEVGKEMLRVAEQGGGFVYYLWDNPAIEGDEIDEVGKAKGTSFKVGYVKKVTLGDDMYVLGSGFYPEEGEAYLTEPKSRIIRGVITVCIVLLFILGVIWWKMRSNKEQ